MPYTTRLWRVGLSAVLCLTLLASPAYAAIEAYVMIKGTKQGQFKGEVTHKGSNQWIPVIAISHGVQSPRDNATGQASGKRQHKPITITREWGAASPQLERARATSELLELVVIEFVRPGPKGEEQVYQTIRLTNALISRINRNGNQASGRAAGKDTHEQEEISFTFEKIEILYANGKKTGTDDWQNSR